MIDFILISVNGLILAYCRFIICVRQYGDINSIEDGNNNVCLFAGKRFEAVHGGMWQSPQYEQC